MALVAVLKLIVRKVATTKCLVLAVTILEQAIVVSRTQPSPKTPTAKATVLALPLSNSMLS